MDQKSIAAVYVKECFSYVLLCFCLSGLMFRSLIHFEFIFVYGVRECFNFVLLQEAAQFFPAPFIEDTVFSPLPPLS